MLSQFLERVALDWRPRRNGSDDNRLHKIRISIKLARWILLRFRMPHRRPSIRRLDAQRAETPGKILCSIFPCNPLISLDSDERIQGNPRQANPLNRGFQSETATVQGIPRIDLTNVAALLPRRQPNRLIPMQGARGYQLPADLPR
jgi:hypothetical protein